MMTSLPDGVIQAGLSEGTDRDNRLNVKIRICTVFVQYLYSSVLYMLVIPAAVLRIPQKYFSPFLFLVISIF